MATKFKFDPRKMMEKAIEVMKLSINESRADKKASPLVGERWSRHPLRGGAFMTAVGAEELRRPLSRAIHQATMARLTRSARTLNRAIHRAIVARFGEAGCPMTATCNESTVEETALAWFGEPAQSHPGSRDNFATRCREHRGSLEGLAHDLQQIHRRR
jgi:hypothetical protein